MTKVIAPQPDLPFPNKVISYCASRLISLGLQPDRDWLRSDDLTILDLLAGGAQRGMAQQARAKVPRSTAVWEASDFYRYAMPLALYDIGSDVMDRFEHFELLYLRILGEHARPWLPSLYLAALASPHLVADCRVNYFNKFDAGRLLVEQEDADRALRLYDDD